MILKLLEISNLKQKKLFILMRTQKKQKKTQTQARKTQTKTSYHYFKGANQMKNGKQKYDELVNEIAWSNRKHNEGTPKEKPWEISEVLFCRLDWLKEQLESNTVELDEAIDTIKMLQIFISGIKDKVIGG